MCAVKLCKFLANFVLTVILLPLAVAGSVLMFMNVNEYIELL